jgi:UDPglucose--hexose-1-phosphate uridylyltransferase
MPELRKDPIVGRWVIIATERVRRPTDFGRRRPPRRGGPCAFCAGHEPETPPEILAYRDGPDAAPNSGDWNVRVVPNKFPALRIEGELRRRGEGIYDLMNGIGAHEVVVESPDHDTELGMGSVAAVETVLRAYRERIADLKRDERFRCVIVFKNRGRRRREPRAPALAAHRHAGRAPRGERRDRQRERVLPLPRALPLLRHPARGGGGAHRLVAESPSVLAFAPFAARFPFETWLAQRRHAAVFEQTDDAVLRDLARVLHTVLRKLDRAIGEPPYNLLLHSAPFGAGESPSYHWHLEILPKLTNLAGFELGSGFHINPVPPEDAARFLRDTPAD